MDYQADELSVDQLLLDPNNYRFRGEKNSPPVNSKRVGEPKVQAAVRNRLEKDGLDELKDSVLCNGFVPVERVVVTKWEHSPAGKDLYVVLEGNRRVATLKKIQEDNNTGVEIPNHVLESFTQLPVIILSSEDPSGYLSIIGIRHVGGIKEWGGFQSAKLVAELKDDFSHSTREVAGRLGLSAQEVNRRFKAYRALEQMREHEEFGDYVTSELYPIFHEALATPRIRKWLGWNDEAYEFKKDDTLSLFYSLISPYVDSSETRREPKITSYSQVRELKTLIDNEDAFESLVDLEKSFSDAQAIVKASDATSDWPSKVKSAIKALNHMGILESTKLSPAQQDTLRQLQTLVDRLLKANAQNERSDVEGSA